jgi:hypothetical protein
MLNSWSQVGARAFPAYQAPAPMELRARAPIVSGGAALPLVRARPGCSYVRCRKPAMLPSSKMPGRRTAEIRAWSLVHYLPGPASITHRAKAVSFGDSFSDGASALTTTESSQRRLTAAKSGLGGRQGRRVEGVLSAGLEVLERGRCAQTPCPRYGTESEDGLAGQVWTCSCGNALNRKAFNLKGRTYQ